VGRESKSQFQSAPKGRPARPRPLTRTLSASAYLPSRDQAPLVDVLGKLGDLGVLDALGDRLLEGGVFVNGRQGVSFFF